MKKRVLRFVTCLTLLTLSTVCVYACNSHEHTEGGWIVVEESTCVEKGLRQKRCKTCEMIMEWEEIEISENHAESEWIIDLEASCTSTGLKHTKCMLCDVEMQSETISVLEHQYDEGICVGCGKDENDQTETHIHNSSKWITETEASCSKVGVKYIECTECHERLQTAEIEKLSHTESEWKVESESTCTKTDKQYKECTVCFDKIVEEEIAKKRHVLRECVYVEPKCEETTVSYYICDVCEEKYNEGEVYGYHSTNDWNFERNKEYDYAYVLNCFDTMTWVYQPESCLGENLGEVSFTCDKCTDTVSIYLRGAGEHKNFEIAYVERDFDYDLDNLGRAVLEINCNDCYNGEGFTEYEIPSNLKYEVEDLYKGIYCDEFYSTEFQEKLNTKYRLCGFGGYFEATLEEVRQYIGKKPYHRLGHNLYTYGDELKIPYIHGRDDIYITIYSCPGGVECENGECPHEARMEEVYWDISYLITSGEVEEIHFDYYDVESFLAQVLMLDSNCSVEVLDNSCTAKNNVKIHCVDCNQDLYFTLKGECEFEAQMISEYECEYSCINCGRTEYASYYGEGLYVEEGSDGIYIYQQVYYEPGVEDMLLLHYLPISAKNVACRYETEGYFKDYMLFTCFNILIPEENWIFG